MFNNLKKPYVIAEVGSNHKGDIKNCFKAIDSAKKAGADCVKFQLYDEKLLAHPKLRTLNYIKNYSVKYQWDRFQSLKLNLEKVKNYTNIVEKKKYIFV